jgi:excisionase family DNA binding protein
MTTRPTVDTTPTPSVRRERQMPAAFVPTVVPVRHLYRIPEAMRLLSMSRSVIYEQIRAGRLRSVCQGRTRLIPATSIQDYVALLLRESEVDYDQTA